MNALEQAPAWLMRPLPANAEPNAELHKRIVELAAELPDSLDDIEEALDEVRQFNEYDPAANLASACVWRALDRFFVADRPQLRSDLLSFASRHMVPEALARVCRRLVKDPHHRVRHAARRLVERGKIREVALPATPEGEWGAMGWLAGLPGDRGLARHKQGRRVQEQNGVPVLRNVGALRELLNIRSPAQLGYFLLATDAENGPYTKFTIPKRGGDDRVICAPKKQLRWVQRMILDKVLSRVPVHDAAHGFVPGRSTVTNAQRHLGAKLLLKFDLTDFFPTIHYYRVLGLFASLGYVVDDARFHTDDDATQVAPTLARLCCYTPDPEAWGSAVMPQGAPTSPALSNLVCRRLDARLEGLAKRNEGVYTRYADDLTFSFKGDGLNVGRFRWWVDQVCHQEGFFVNQKKFRVIRASQRQVVTGLVVNDTLRVPREERRRFRAILFNCKTKGIESQARGNPKFTSWLRGYASYIHMVHPEEGAALLEQVEALLGPEAAPEGGS